MTPHFIDVGSIRTRYFRSEVRNDAETVVLLHGGNLGSRGGCISAENWNCNWDALAQKFNVVAIDRLGQGQTDVPTDAAGFTMEASVAHALATLDSLDIRRAHLVGHSRGGYVVASLAMRRPELAVSCVIVSSGTLAPGVDNNHFVLAEAPRPFLSRASQQWIFERSSFRPEIVTDAWLDEAEALAVLPKNQKALQRMEEEGLFQSMFQPRLAVDKALLLGKLQHTGLPCPTLVLWGRNDPLACVLNGIALARMLAAAQKQTEFCVLNGAGHFVFREQAEVFNRRVAGFIEARGVKA